MGAGRFAPSPSGDLHVGNLRTAILAWLFARSSSRGFLLRIEDLDRARAGAEAGQLHDLAAIGLDWDGDVVRQSERLDLFDDAIGQLRARGLLYECFCTRRDIAEAASAPHAAPGAYPGTCRTLDEARRAAKREVRPAAWRLLTEPTEFTITDLLHGEYTGPSMISWCCATTGFRPITWQSSSMTRPRASIRWCAGTTCSPPLHGRPIWRRC